MIINRIIKIIPHITIVLCIMFMIFLYLDNLNPTMNFVNCQMSRVLLLILCICSVGTAIGEIWLSRRK